VGGGPKEWVNRRPVAVLPGAAGEVDPSRPDYKVVVRWGYVNSTRQDRLPVYWMLCRKDPGSPEDLGQAAAGFGRDVDCDQNCCRQVGRQPSHEGGQNLDASRGTPDYYQALGRRLGPRAHSQASPAWA
jgi:hypothetical protein